MGSVGVTFIIFLVWSCTPLAGPALHKHLFLAFVSVFFMLILEVKNDGKGFSTFVA